MSTFLLLCALSVIGDGNLLGIADENVQLLQYRAHISNNVKEQVVVSPGYASNDTSMTLHYLRIPKTGSSSFILMLQQAWRTHPEECKHVVLHIHHGYTADDFAQNEPKQDVGFVVLREPVERFVSQVFHLQRELGLSQFPQLETPVTWGNALLQDSSLHDSFFSHGQSKFALHHAIPWKQSTYASSDILKACLPSMVSDIQAILDEHAPGCKLDSEVHANEDPTPDEELSWRNDPQVIELAKKLYPEDFVIWQDSCA